jgi:mRNA-degrading endonuclease toxin of MazEF toxin-antitoxin module
MRRGEVRWYRFSAPDRKWPVVILTRDSALEFLGEVALAPITATIRGIPTEVPLSIEDEPLFFGLSSRLLARRMGRSPLGWFCIGAFFGPFGWLVLLLPPKR